MVQWFNLVSGMLLIFSCNYCSGSYTDEEELQNQLPEIVDYNFHVQPILSDKCYRCHGPDENARKADLRLDTRNGLLGTGLSGEPAILPGKPKRSHIIDRITSDDPEFMMPPPDSKLSISDQEAAILTKWIAQGAEWKPHWSFIPLQKPDLPAIKEIQWVNNEIDYFVLSRLEKEGLKPQSQVDKETLLRRVTLDLTGLPPTMDEIEGFLKDQSSDAYEKVVDRLLRSPHYGEHMAVDWLDLARYADTHGYQADFYRPHWPWRDWVIQAFNNNMSYDEFVTWQLAGDMLPDASKDQILATGFNRNHAQNNEGGIVQEEFRVEYVADRTQTFGTAFLGLTMQCARCHDHKYDPVSQKEFYQLFAFFNNVAESGQTTFYQPDMPGPTLLLPDEEQAEQIAYIEKLTREKETEIEAYKEQRFEQWKDNGTELPEDPLVRGLIAYYPLDQVSNNQVPNKVKNGINGSIIDPVFNKLTRSVPQVVPGAKGKALRLTGDDAISFPGTGRFDKADPFSIGIWVKIPNELTHGVIFHSNKGSALYTYKGYQVSIEEDRFDVRLAHNFPYNAIHLKSSTQVPRNQWAYLVLTYDGSSEASGVRLYLNGEELPMEVKQNNLYKDIVFYPKDGAHEPPVDQHLKIGARWRGKGFTNGEVDEIKVYNRDLTAVEVRMVSGAKLKNVTTGTSTIGRQQFDYYLINQDAKYRNKLDQLKGLRKRRNRLIEPVFEVMVMDEMPEPRTAFILDRGIYDQPVEAVAPGTPNAVMPFEAEGKPDRLGLARWLFDPANPLPARVTVNRFWQHYFGLGLVKTSDDFGSQGERPSHPMLLDWLAVEFIESGWDVKHLQKKIVMSSSYRQSSEASEEGLSMDRENRMLTRGPVTRLSAESLRDLVLSASSLLERKIGGPSVKPYQPDGLWAYNAFSARYEQDHGADLYRRSLYTFWKRTNPPPSMNIFDAPSRSYCVVKREKTATPLQALVLLNDPQFVEASRVLAQRIMSEATTIEGRITLGFRLLTTKHPRPDQLKLLEAQYREAAAAGINNMEAVQSLLSVGEYPLNKEHPVTELAAYTKVMSTIMNFDATTMKR